MKKSKLWLGLTGVASALLTLVLSGTILANANAMLINDVLGISTSGLNLVGSSYKMNDEGYGELIKDSYEYCVKQLEEGSVLLKNDGALPLAATERNVTLFGNNSAHVIYRSGAGGPTPNDEYVVDMQKAFTDGGFKINKKLYKAYETSGVKVSLTSSGEVPSAFYTSELKSTFDSFKDVAIVTFARYGTENTDPTRVVDGRAYLALSKNEEDLLQMIKDDSRFTKTIVLLNGVLPMELDWLDKYQVNACIWYGNPGYYGLPGIVNILKGDANPSGHTVETFANNTLNSPAMRNFGDYNYAFDGSAVDGQYGRKYVVYKEGIYVGYKYYETRYEDCILGQGDAKCAEGATEGETEWNYAKEVSFPFGFGLSYSTFTQKIENMTYNAKDDTFTLKVKVSNTSNKAGKEVVQVYAQTPYTEYDKDNALEKASVQLMGYTKVDVPAGQSVEAEVTFSRYLMASYDIKADGGKGAYILEPGKYYFAVGNGAHEALNNILAKKGKTGMYDHNGKTVTGSVECVSEYDPALTATDATTYKKSQYTDKKVENKFADADLNYWADDDQKITYLTRKDWKNTFPTTVTTLHANERIVNGLRMDQYKKSEGAPSYKAMIGKEVDVELEEPIDFVDMKNVPFEDEKWDKFISQLTLDELCVSVSDARGIAAVAKVNKPMNAIAEGPEGLLAKFKYGDKRACTGFATLPTTTATWDHVMQGRYGEMMGEEALFSGVAMVNAPGCNIIRTPYGSRASEYMSEDGVLSYYSVSNIISMTRKKGLICNVKHCFLNNQETNRQGVSTFANEQSIREIYLRPFEGALTRGKSMGIMTSYNRIGLQYAATHSVLMNDVLRGEWGYEGSIIDDALTQSAYYSVGADMLLAGTDIFCLDGQRGAQIKAVIKKTDDGTLVKGLQRANKRIFYSLLHSSMGGSITSDTKVTEGMYWWQGMLIGIDVLVGVLTLGAIAGFVMTTYVKRKVKEAV